MYSFVQNCEVLRYVGSVTPQLRKYVANDLIHFDITSENIINKEVFEFVKNISLLQEGLKLANLGHKNS